MAKKVTGYIKLQIPAGKATPAPPVGPALGQHGVNIVEFTKQFNAKTADQGDGNVLFLQDPNHRTTVSSLARSGESRGFSRHGIIRKKKTVYVCPCRRLRNSRGNGFGYWQKFAVIFCPPCRTLWGKE